MKFLFIRFGIAIILVLFGFTACQEEMIQTQIPLEQEKPTLPQPTIPPTATFTFTPIPPPTRTVGPTRTSTPLPTLTATTIPWQEFKMTYAIKIGNIGKLWMPVPQEWDGIGMSNVKVENISPEPSDLYKDEQGNLIAFWEIQSWAVREYRIEFVIDLSPVGYSIDPDLIGPYDTSSLEYQRYTRPSSRIESDHDVVIQLAKDIVGDERNPYHQAQLIHSWMIENINVRGEDGETALSVIEKRSGSCGGRSWLFVALLRSLGVPARSVQGLHSNPESSVDFFSGEFWEGSLGTHAWSEFYLPGYGWIQTDAGNSRDFAAIEDLRIVLSRGDELSLSHGHPLELVAWFHIPHTDIITQADPPTQNPGEKLSLTVERVP